MDKRESLPGIALILSLFIITIVSSIGVMMSNETQQKVKFHIYENFFSQAYLDLLSLEVIGKEYLKPEQNRLQIALASSSESIENSLSFETENGRVFGNFYDRIAHRAVPDFIDFHVGNFHWFIFNVSDIFITIELVLIILLEIFLRKDKFQNNKN